MLEFDVYARLRLHMLQFDSVTIAGLGAGLSTWSIACVSTESVQQVLKYRNRGQQTAGRRNIAGRRHWMEHRQQEGGTECFGVVMGCGIWPISECNATANMNRGHQNGVSVSVSV